MSVALAAQAKPAWQAEWEKIVEAAKKEGQLSIYISGYEEVLPDFQKEYPEIKVAPITGRGSQVGQRLLAERRADKFLADVVSAGGVTTYQQLFPAKVFDPIKPRKILNFLGSRQNEFLKFRFWAICSEAIPKWNERFRKRENVGNIKTPAI